VTPLSGLPAHEAARRIASLPAYRAAAELLGLDLIEAARDLTMGPDAVGGAVLTAIAVTSRQPAVARKILETVTAERAGRLLDHMSSAAAALVLALPAASAAVGRLVEADTPTVVAALAEMPPSSAASLVQAMDNETRAVEVLGRMPDAAHVASILLCISPPTRRQALLDRQPAPFRALVSKHMERIAGADIPRDRLAQARTPSRRGAPSATGTGTTARGRRTARP
jgi:hypothetical protein